MADELEQDLFLSEQAERFCITYVSMKKPNQTRAATLAGYSEKTAAVQASRLLRNVKVQARIRQLRREALEASGYDKDAIRELIMRRETGIVATSITDLIQVSPGKDDPNRERILSDLAAVHGGQRMLDFGGVLVAPLNGLTEEEKSAIKSLKIEGGENGALSVNIELYDPTPAARVLAEISGLKKPEVQLSISLAERLDKARRKVSERKAADARKNAGSN